MFPEAIVYGTNLKDTIQYEFATDYGKEYNFKIIPNLKEIKNIDLVFASEYFEHILNPIDHLIEVLYYSNTKNLIIANSFNTKSIGHFNEYQVADKTVPASKLSRIFNSELRNQGWNQIKTEIWNNKPAYWTDEI